MSGPEMSEAARYRLGGSLKPIGLNQDQQHHSPLCVGGGCRQPSRRHHGARTKARDGADCVARRPAHDKGFAAILQNRGDCGDDGLLPN
jgi:hypothetical protein